MEIRLKYIIIVVIGVICLTSISAFVFAILIVKLSTSSNSDGLQVAYVYNPITNSTSRTVFHVGKSMKKYEFISFYNEEGNYVTISSFGDLEYECTGSCVCHDDEFVNGISRRSTSVLMNSLYFIIAASSLTFAMHYANQYFQDSCEKQYSHMCALTDFDYGGCVPRKDILEEIEEGPYKCNGWCASLDQVAKIFEDDSAEAVKGVMFQHTETIKGRYPELQEKANCDSQFKEEVFQAKTTLQARTFFITGILNDFCADIGFIGDTVELREGELDSVCMPNIRTVECARLL